MAHTLGKIEFFASHFFSTWDYGYAAAFKPYSAEGLRGRVALQSLNLSKLAEGGRDEADDKNYSLRRKVAQPVWY